MPRSSEKDISFDFDNLGEENIEVLTQLVTDAETPEPLKVKILQKFIEGRKDQPFFDAMLEDGLDFGECPCCGFATNWLVPEVELNQRGIVSSELDPRVKAYTTADDCSQYQEACHKKRVSF
jgi:hypothetical protein